MTQIEIDRRKKVREWAAAHPEEAHAALLAFNTTLKEEERVRLAAHREKKRIYQYAHRKKRRAALEKNSGSLAAYREKKRIYQAAYREKKRRARLEAEKP